MLIPELGATHFPGTVELFLSQINRFRVLGEHISVVQVPMIPTNFLKHGCLLGYFSVHVYVRRGWNLQLLFINLIVVKLFKRV